MKKKLVILIAVALSILLMLTVVALVVVVLLVLNVDFLGFSLWQTFWLLIVAIVIDMPQTLARSFFLFLYQIFERGARRQFIEGPLRVSVVVPAHNESKYITRTIECLLENIYPYKEIIVVDDGSTDDTYLKAASFANNPIFKAVKKETCSGTKAMATDYGLLFAKEDIVVITDGDTMLERNTISKLVEGFGSGSNVIAVAGNVRVFNAGSFLTRLQAYEYFVSMEVGRRLQGIIGGLLDIPGALGAMRRDVLGSVGCLHVDTITEDFDLTTSLHKTKGEIVFAPEAIAWTYAPEKWGRWIQQRKRWAFGQIQVYLKHSDIFFRKRVGVTGLLTAPNNVFMDMALLFVRYTWLVGFFILNFLSPFYLLKVFSVILGFYLILETWGILTATILSPRRTGLKNLFLLPFMVFFYRPLYSTIRLRAYVSVLFRRKLTW
jgi:cellulose synthase/poly-beta-1,6-N-acetylglucosamine synthase-like glycosyltransferase